MVLWNRAYIGIRSSEEWDSYVVELRFSYMDTLVLFIFKYSHMWIYLVLIIVMSWPNCYKVICSNNWWGNTTMSVMEKFDWWILSFRMEYWKLLCNWSWFEAHAFICMSKKDPGYLQASPASHSLNNWLLEHIFFIQIQYDFILKFYVV